LRRPGSSRERTLRWEGWGGWCSGVGQKQRAGGVAATVYGTCAGTPASAPNIKVHAQCPISQHLAGAQVKAGAALRNFQASFRPTPSRATHSKHARKLSRRIQSRI